MSEEKKPTPVEAGICAARPGKRPHIDTSGLAFKVHTIWGHSLGRASVSSQSLFMRKEDGLR